MADTETQSTMSTAEADAAMDGHVEEILKNAEVKLAEIKDVATQVVTVKAQITEGHAVITAKSEHIKKAQEHADKVGADLDHALTAAKQQVAAAEAQTSYTQSAADDAAKLLTDMQTTKGSVDTNAAAVETARGTVEQSVASTQDLADKSTKVKESIAAYEERLSELDTQYAAQLKTIEALLPGATSAGLAYAWDERRKTFLKPHNRWEIAFAVCVSVLVVLAVTGMWQLYSAATPPAWDEYLRVWLSRLPVAVILVWVAMRASRGSALAERLEEDYGYKSAIASCFEGFKKQVSEVGRDVAPDSPLAKLLDNTLTTIATPPGRIYDKHKLAASPTDGLKEIAQAVAETLKQAKTGS